MLTLKNFYRFLLPAIFLFTSCVKDVDLEQAGEIAIPPTAAVDLVYFTLDRDKFLPRNSTGPKKTADEVRLEFLDDEYIQNDLVRADLNFRYTNTFANPVKSELVFLSENNREQYRIVFTIPGGNTAIPGVVNYTEIIEGAHLESFKEAIKLRIELEMFSGSVSEEGKLQLKSKAFLKFEF